jgi:hypothetical protein
MKLTDRILEALNAKIQVDASPKESQTILNILAKSDINSIYKGGFVFVDKSDEKETKAVLTKAGYIK